jgi:voltage-gated potassium channel
MARAEVRSLRQRALRMSSSRAFAQRELGYFIRRLAFLSFALVALVCIGAGAFAIFEDTTWWKGFMHSVDTITTIGSIPHPRTLGGEITNLVLIALGLGTLFYLLVTVTELFVAGELWGLLEVRRMERRIADLTDHYLICGFGRVGHQVARDLRSADVPFVVIDENPAVQEDMEQEEVLHIDGRGSDDETLRKAGIDHARAVIACVDSDAENIFITLTARGLRPDIEIVARASQEGSEMKLLRAGANDVISPYKASGHAMARLALASDDRSVTAPAPPATR